MNTHNFQVSSGSSYKFRIVVYNSQNNPLDLTSSTYASVAKRTVGAGYGIDPRTTLSEPTLALDITVEDAEAGKLLLSVSSATSRSVKPGTFAYDVQIQTESTTETILRGQITILPSPTEGIS